MASDMTREDKQLLTVRFWLLSRGDGSAPASGIGGERACANLNVNVVFTEPKGTLAALQTAAQLACGLHAAVRLIAPQEVPFGFALDSPPVSEEFMCHRLADLVRQAIPEPLEATVHLFLCRSKWDALGRILNPNSVVLIGGKRLWPNEASSIARMLRAAGHEVIFVSRRPLRGTGKTCSTTEEPSARLPAHPK